MGSRADRWTALLVVILVATSGGVLLASTPSASAPLSVPSPAGPASPATVPVSSEPSEKVVAPGYQPPSGTALLGALPAGTPLRVVVGLPSSDPSGLAAYVAGEYVSGSSSYRAYLTPTELGHRYGPDPSVVDRARQYFSGYGLNSSALPGGFLVDVQGPSAAVGSAFGTTFEEYRDPSGQLIVSHPTAAALPAGLGVTGAYGLGDTNAFRPFANAAGPISPGLVPLASCGSGPSGELSPCEIQTAYSSAAFIASGTNGSGERIGIVDAYDGGEPQSRLASDFADFTGQFGLPSGNVSYAYPVPTMRTDLNNSSANAPWGLEEALDLEWARAAAPGASIVLAFSPDAGPGLLYAVNWMVATHTVDVISMSWGEPLTGIFNAYSQPCDVACNASTDGTYTILDPVLEAAAAEGISVFAASGDCGAADGTSGFAVNYPAADPFATAVGGTVLRTTANGTYLGESGWNGSASGTAAPGCANQGGSGGGFSGLPRPAWQGGLPNASGGRAVPDVSLDAATPVTVVYGGSFGGAWGTSLGTPVWAGIAALGDQWAGRPLGFLTPALYDISRSSNYSVDFRDVLLGNNGYPAGPGWDPVTGIGTPLVGGLVPDLAGAISLPLHRPTAFLYASPRYGQAPLTVSFVTNTSRGTGSYPVEGINYGDGNSSLAGGSTRHEYRRPGVYAAQAFTIDSGGNASASPPIAIVVGGGTALSVQLSASSLSPATGAAVTFTVGASGGTAPYTFDFSFGDGTYLANRTGPTVVHTFGAPGGYCTEVVARDAASPVDGAASPRLGIAVGGAAPPDCENDSVPISLTPNPVAPIRDAPAEFPSLFTSNGGAAAPPGLSNSFQYGASDPYVRACQCGIFRSPGTYSVVAWENDTVSQEATARTNVTVMPPLVGDFSASSLSGPAPLTVNFSATVTGGYHAQPANTRWTFGDDVSAGTSAVGARVAHTFTTPGEYIVIGLLSDAGHGNTSEAFLIDVEGAPSADAYGVRATISPAVKIASGTVVHFSGGIVGPSENSGLVLRWGIGPGPAAFGAAVNETYYAPSSPGLGGLGALVNNTLSGSVEIVNLSSASDAAVARGNFTLPTFFAVEPGGFVPRASALSFHATLSPRYGPVPLTTYGAAEVRAPGSSSVTWFFGDGTSASGLSANHTYPSTGALLARTEVTDSLGDVAVASYGVQVNGTLTIVGGPSVSSGTAPLRVTFRAVALGGYGPPYTYSWTFSAGPPANGSVTNRTFSAAGTYTATVHVTAGKGLPVNRSWTVAVAPPIGLPAVALLGGAGAVGIGIGLLAVWAGRRTRGTFPAPPFSP